jgi:hypothetical protein
MNFTSRITPHVNKELAKAFEHRLLNQSAHEFSFLERAHVLGQESTVQHVRAHCLMLAWSIRNRDLREFIGQLFRIVGAATKTAFGLIPIGNTGGANVSPFKPLPVPKDLEQILRAVKHDG